MAVRMATKNNEDTYKQTVYIWTELDYETRNDDWLRKHYQTDLYGKHLHTNKEKSKWWNVTNELIHDRANAEQKKNKQVNLKNM